MLDLAGLYGQVEDMVRRMDEMRPVLQERTKLAADALAAPTDHDLGALRERIDASRTPWLVAKPQEPPGRRYPLPPCPLEYVAVSADGSQIPPDRHAPAMCYVINVAGVLIRYGRNPRVRFTGDARLFYEDADLYEDLDGTTMRIGEAALAARRTRMEFDHLAKLINEAQGDEVPAVAFVDGTLILWSLWNTRTEEARRRGLQALQELLNKAGRARLPVAGYISDPGSGEAANVARVLLCPMAGPDCAQCRYKADGEPPCAPGNVADTSLYRKLLPDPGSRSAVFESRSRILDEYTPENRVHFFYLNTGAEIARIEVPGWVAADRALLDLVHAVAYDQARKGMGYPVIIDEAHKQAVVTSAGRRVFARVVEEVMARRGFAAAVSAKSYAKRGGIL